MPGYDAAVSGRFAEKLIVPETTCAAQQLRGRQQERRIPEQVMKARSNAPRAQRMKQRGRWISRLVGMEFIEEFVAGVIWVDKFGQLCAKDFDLLLVQEAYAGEIAVGVEEFDLIV